jgi:hypothetical protein
VRASFATSKASEDELPVVENVPPWFSSLDKFVIDVGALA